MNEDPVRAEAERSLAIVTALMDGDSATFIALRDEAISADPAQALSSMTWLLRLSLNAIAAMSNDELAEALRERLTKLAQRAADFSKK